MRIKAMRIVVHLFTWLAVYLLPFLVTYGTLNATVLFNEPGGVVHTLSTALLICYAYLNHYQMVPQLYLHRKYVMYGVLVIASVIIVIWFPQFSRFFEHNRASA